MSEIDELTSFIVAGLRSSMNYKTWYLTKPWPKLESFGPVHCCSRSPFVAFGMRHSTKHVPITELSNVGAPELITLGIGSELFLSKLLYCEYFIGKNKILHVLTPCFTIIWKFLLWVRNWNYRLYTEKQMISQCLLERFWESRWLGTCHVAE